MRLFISSLLLLLSTALWAGECDDNLFSMSAYEKKRYSITIKDVLLDLTRDCHLTILFGDKESKKRINEHLDFVNIKGYTFEEFLSFLLNDHNLFYDYDSKKSILTISYQTTKTFNIDYLNLSEMSTKSTKTIQSGSTGATGGTTGTGTTGTGGGGSSKDTTSITASYEFKFWDELKKGVEHILNNTPGAKGMVFINQDAAIVTVRSTYRGMKKAEEYIEHLMRKMHKQVMVEAKLIEVTYNDSNTKGIDWSQFDVSFNGNIVGDKVKDFPSSMAYTFGYNLNMNGLFNFLKKYGKVKVLSSPKILTLNNQPAVINVGNSLSYKFQTGTLTTTQGAGSAQSTFSIGSTFVGLTLQIIPEITDNGDIIMRINPISSEMIATDAAKDASIVREMPPDMKVKQLTSIVKVKDGQKVLIGGLVQETKGGDDKKVPLLGDIPIVGGIFHSSSKTKTRSELFILIIPTIIHEDNVPTIDEAGL
ncbi:secretin N-terminal domain-containing protein [Hydrogenimonas thermophila]|uniref:type II secretion system protein GspD n=1 Tax=Hydrogenimonas thermophila TaxID=223786 RepID=UPI0029373FC9|nr:secretin N-terminal domain-containing protein [Hydrogenimonas thermophila]WOE69713.1 secretin N-terminal domain-containing protein [Hydrogenimonas thermophila]WOE72227.1 secretin N-terminal domain-containing protein [Hydrogenimonas thermophila]